MGTSTARCGRARLRRRAPALRLVTAVGFVLLAGCGSGTAQVADRGPDDPAVATSSTPTPAADASDGTLTLAFAGDVHFEQQLRDHLDKPAALAPIRTLLGDADIAMVNLETAITEAGTRQGKEFTFRAPASALPALRGAGVDVVTLANNHGADFGRDGLDDTVRALREHTVSGVDARVARPGADLAAVGIGASVTDALAPVIVEAEGRRVAFLGISNVADLTYAKWSASADSPGIASTRDIAPVLAAVRDARERSDLVVVYAHWGIEHDGCPSGAQQSLSSQLARAGADVIVGSHTHLLQAAGHKDVDGRRVYVAYGLGNFAFYSSPGSDAARTGALTLTVRDRDVVDSRWEPAGIDARGLPMRLTGGAVDTAHDQWEELRRCADVS